MFDDGFDTVTINLPQSVHNQRHDAEIDILPEDISDDLIVGLEEEYYHDLISRSTTEELIRDYSIDVWNGSPGLAHWGYVAKDHWDANRR